MTQSDEVLFEIREGIATVKLNRPAARNALSMASNERLGEIWEEVDSIDRVRVVILTASECGTFCAGMDLKEAARVCAERNCDILDVLKDPFYDRMRAVSKPIIAAMPGHFTAAGMVMAMHADIRIGLAGTSGGIAEAKVGRGSPWAAFLLGLMPQSLLLEMIFTGNLVPVERLREVGFINYVEATPEAVLNRAAEIARSIVRCAPLSVSVGKKSLHMAQELGAKAGFEAAKKLHVLVYGSEDAKEGPRAFAEKRQPKWIGR